MCMSAHTRISILNHARIANCMQTHSQNGFPINGTMNNKLGAEVAAFLF